MQSVDTLRAEHDGVLVVLAHLERAVSAAEQGRPVPADVFRDIQEFFAVFVDRCHHGKEEAEIFPRLERGEDAWLVESLDTQHDAGRQLAANYAAAVQAYEPGNVATGQQVASTSRAYAEFLRAHIELETNQLFPAMERALALEDQFLTAAFERIEQERIGPGTHQRLHGMIEGLAARIDPYMQ